MGIAKGDEVLAEALQKLKEAAAKLRGGWLELQQMKMKPSTTVREPPAVSSSSTGPTVKTKKSAQTLAAAMRAYTRRVAFGLPTKRKLGNPSGAVSQQKINAQGNRQGAGSLQQMGCNVAEANGCAKRSSTNGRHAETSLPCRIKVSASGDAEGTGGGSFLHGCEGLRMETVEPDPFSGSDVGAEQGGRQSEVCGSTVRCRVTLHP